MNSILEGQVMLIDLDDKLEFKVNTRNKQKMDQTQ